MYQEFLSQTTDVSKESFFTECWGIIKDVFPPHPEVPTDEVPTDEVPTDQVQFCNVVVNSALSQSAFRGMAGPV